MSAQPNVINPTAELPVRHVAFGLLLLLGVLLWWKPLCEVVGAAWSEDRYFYVLTIPFAALLLAMRTQAFKDTPAWHSPAIGLIAGLLGVFIARPRGLVGGVEWRPFVTGLVMVMFTEAVFLFCYGTKAFRTARSACLLLLLSIPPPPALLDRVTFGLQHGSAVIVDLILSAANVPFWRDGFSFVLPDTVIEIAPQCSGIRSFSLLFLCALVLGAAYLRSHWSRAILALLTLPLALVKNGIRIAVIALGASYWDRDMLSGSFHLYGGAALFLVALLILFVILRGLQRMELKSHLPWVPLHRNQSWFSDETDSVWTKE